MSWLLKAMWCPCLFKVPGFKSKVLFEFFFPHPPLPYFFKKAVKFTLTIQPVVISSGSTLDSYQSWTSDGRWELRVQVKGLIQSFFLTLPSLTFLSKGFKLILTILPYIISYGSTLDDTEADHPMEVYIGGFKSKASFPFFFLTLPSLTFFNKPIKFILTMHAFVISHGGTLDN